MPESVAVKMKVQVEELTRFPRAASLYAIKELARRSGVTSKQFQTWRVAFDDAGFVKVFVQPGTNKQIRFPQADLWYWKELYAGQFRTSTARWFRDPSPGFATVTDFKIPFSSDSRAEVGPLFQPAGKECVECAVDLPTSTLLTLARFEETFPVPRDPYGRFSARSSIAWQEGFLHRPIVDEYSLAMEQAISYLLPGWTPAERRLRVKLGHDVDELGVPFSLRTALGHTVRRKLPSATVRDFLTTVTGIDTTYEMFLRKLVNLSREHGLRASVYWQADVSGARRKSYDLKHSRIRSLIADFRAAGLEMGIHPTYETYGSLEKLRTEVSAVQEALGAQRIGGRQDFLRWSPETWVHWDALGLAYDATVGFADSIGFRAGTSYPYRPWLLSKGREAQLLEIPLMAMDSTALGYMKLSPHDALRELLDCIERCRVVGGVFSLLWHNTKLIDEGYRTVYEELLDELTGSESYDGRAGCDGDF